MGEDDADLPALAERLASLKTLRARARARAEVTAAPQTRLVVTGESFAEASAGLDDELARRDLLLHALEEVIVRRAEVRPQSRTR